MKITELKKELKKHKLDGCLLFNEDPNYLYLAQEKKGSVLFIPANLGRPTIFFNKLENLKTPFKKIVYENLFEQVKIFFERNNIRKIGINEFELSVKQLKRIKKIAKPVDVSKELYDLRITKTKEEIAKIKQACLLTEKIFSKIVANFKFKTEKELKDFIKKEAIDLGCELSFEPIVASEKNAATPHYDGNAKLKRGFLIIDMGLKYEYYCADMTRTFFLGKPSSNELKIYDEILDLQKEVIKKIKPGVMIKELELFVREKMMFNEKYFIHSLGHGLGVEVHEQPALSRKSVKKLKPNMVITIEPGIYKDFGIRIEDDLLVVENGSKLLTRFSKELIIINKP